MLEFTYNYGRGRVQLNLDEILPCSAANLKRIMSFVNLSDDPDEHAKAVYNYIAAQVDELKNKRSQEDGNSAAGKEKISKINASMKKYLSNAATLSKYYGLPELSDKGAQVVLHAATVYRVIYSRNENRWTVEPSDGWIFEKGGFSFDVHREKRERKSDYIIMLHNTGAECARAKKKSAIASEITPRLLDILKGKAVEIEKATEKYNSLMIAAGYMEPERAETISFNEQEDETMSNYTFTTKTVTCKGNTFPCEYTVTADGTVLVFVVLREKENGRKEKQRIHFNSEHPDHAAALAAALAAAKAGEEHANIAAGYKAEPATENAEKSFSEPEQAAETIRAEPEPERAARDSKQARGPVPEKTFIGETIQGNGWRIFFDGETGRTRVIFEGVPTEAAKAATQNAGFYYSPNMKSWNKKLTFKAYRAAKALSEQLSTLYAA